MPPRTVPTKLNKVAKQMMPNTILVNEARNAGPSVVLNTPSTR